MSFPRPTGNPVAEPYWSGLKQGRLLFQRCRKCTQAWLPARECCPRCLSPEVDWVESAGRGKVVSWIVYHTAYDDAFKDRVPYDVTLVELDEGLRMLTNVVDGQAGKALKVDARVKLKIEAEGDLALARFELDR